MNLIKAFLFSFVFLLGFKVSSQNLFYNFPKDFQFYERDSNGFGKVSISGAVSHPDYESIKLVILQNGHRYYDKKVSLRESKSFSWQTELLAGLFEYDFEIKVYTKADSSSIVKAGKVLCGDTYLIYGQSNALAGCCFQDIRRQLDHTFIRNYVYDHFQPSSSNNGWHDLNVEFNWPGVVGTYLAKSIIENHKIPVQVINGAVGGESLESLSFRDSVNHENPETYYGRFLKRIKGSKTEKSKGFIFCQGEWESDTGEPSALNAYRNRFNTLMKNLKEDGLISENRYLIQTNILATASRKEVPGELRDVQRKLKEDFPEMRMYASVGTEVSGDGLHYSRSGFESIARDIYLGIENDFYKKTSTSSVTGPLIQKAVHDGLNKRIRLVFDKNQELVVQNIKDYGSYQRRFKDYIYNQNGEAFIDSASASNNEVTLYYSGSFKNTLSYLPSIFTDDYSLNYNGPLIENINGLSALSFDKFKTCEQLASPVIKDYELVKGVLVLRIKDKKECSDCTYKVYGKQTKDKNYTFLSSSAYASDSLIVDFVWSKEAKSIALQVKIESKTCESGYTHLVFNKCSPIAFTGRFPFSSQNVKNGENLDFYPKGNVELILSPSEFTKPLNGIYAQEAATFSNKIGSCLNN